MFFQIQAFKRTNSLIHIVLGWKVRLQNSLPPPGKHLFFKLFKLRFFPWIFLKKFVESLTCFLDFTTFDHVFHDNLVLLRAYFCDISNHNSARAPARRCARPISGMFHRFENVKIVQSLTCLVNITTFNQVFHDDLVYLILYF